MSNSIRLGGAEFYRDNPSDAHYGHARVLFMEEISKVAPWVLTELRDQVLPVYNAARKDRGFNERHLESWESVSSSTPTHRPYLLKLKTRITQFAIDHHLDAEWACAIFLRTVREWSPSIAKIAATSSRPLPWAYPPGSARFALSRGEEHEQKVAREEHKSGKAVTKLVEQRGFKRSALKHDVTHFRQLARFQILGWSHERIASEKGQMAGRKTVSEALARTAALLPLDLRPTGKPGRPRTST